MKYKKINKKYKYLLMEELDIYIPYACAASNAWITIEDGYITIRKHYAWDGASSIAWDDKTNMRGSLVHDALYQLMREGILGIDPWRKWADEIFRDLCIEDGMSKFRAGYYYWAVRNFAAKSATPDAFESEVIEI